MDLFSEEYLAHYGILGQKWGVRRFQNLDGSLTSSGRKRYQENGSLLGGDAASVSDAVKIQKRNADYRKARTIQRVISMGATAAGTALLIGGPIGATLGLMSGGMAAGQVAVESMLVSWVGKSLAGMIGGAAIASAGNQAANSASERYLSSKGYDTTAYRVRSNN